jgi:hypothetical protein
MSILSTTGGNMAQSLKAFNLKRWIDEHRDLLKPPVDELARGESDILLELRKVAAHFNSSASLRTCKACGYVQPAPTGPRV